MAVKYLWLFPFPGIFSFTAAYMLTALIFSLSSTKGHWLWTWPRNISPPGSSQQDAPLSTSWRQRRLMGTQPQTSLLSGISQYLHNFQTNEMWGVCDNSAVGFFPSIPILTVPCTGKDSLIFVNSRGKTIGNFVLTKRVMIRYWAVGRTQVCASGPSCPSK